MCCTMHMVENGQGDNDMKKLASLERIKIMRTGQTIPCPKCDGNIGAVGNPQTTAIFRCDKCGIGMVLTIKMENKFCASSKPKKKVYNFDYTIYPDNSQEVFKNTCTKIENNYPDIVKENLLTDVDGTTIQIYHIGRKKIAVYDDYEVGAVYVRSDVNLESVFE